MAVLLAVYEVPHILLPQVDQLEPALPVELGLLELPLVLCTQHAVAEAFEVAFAVVDAVFDEEDTECPCADDGHERFFVEVAEEIGSDYFHVLLV